MICTAVALGCHSWPVQPSCRTEALKGTESSRVGGSSIACRSRSALWQLQEQKGPLGSSGGCFLLSELNIVALSPPELLTSKSFGSGIYFG